jgi:hydrogenase maturation factor
MCVGAINELVDTWEHGGTRIGLLADGSVVTLAFVPAARVGDRLLVHLGIPVEVLDPDAAAEALSLRTQGGTT